VKRLFDCLDTDCDGYVTSFDVQLWVKACIGECRITTEEIDSLFTRRHGARPLPLNIHHHQTHSHHMGLHHHRKSSTSSSSFSLLSRSNNRRRRALFDPYTLHESYGTYGLNNNNNNDDDSDDEGDVLHIEEEEEYDEAIEDDHDEMMIMAHRYHELCLNYQTFRNAIGRTPLLGQRLLAMVLNKHNTPLFNFNIIYIFILRKCIMTYIQA
jgi:hypothetical protein